MPIFIIWCLCFWTIYQTAHDVLDIVRLRRMRNFYQHLLHVPDTDIQTIEWRDVIARLMDLKDLNPNVDDKKRSPLVKEFMGRQSKAKLDAHDVAHRLMRKENYMIAMFNKEIIDLSIPYKVPFVEIAAKQLTRPMVLWCLNFVIMDFFFDKNGHLNPMVLDLKQRKRLIAALRARFTFIGTIAFMACPFVFVYTFILCFYQNFTEFQKNATAMGARRYTPWAQLQFREFNELPHLFNHRLNMSHPFASRYLEQFPKRKTAEIARFVTLVLGGLLAILGVGFIIFSEAHLVDFEITEGYSVLWYVTIIGAAWGVARGMIPDETDVFFPEYVLRQVIQYIRYMPAEWKGRLHSDEVRAEFQEMYELRLVSFVWELAATVLTGFICFGGLQKSSERIVDFFHDNTVHVEGLGHVCSYAVFDFEKGPRGPKTGAGRADVGGLNMADNELDDFYLSKHGKMAASYFGFLDNYAANPKGLGHVPPAMSPELHQQNFGFQPPPAWPGMHGMANTGIMDMARSRPALARSVIPGQTARRQPMASSGVFDHGISPVSNLPPLPHESSFATGTRKSIYNPARSRFHTRNVVEDFDEEAEIGLDDRQDKGKGRMGESRFGPVPEASMLDWETGARNSKTEEDAGPDPEAQLGGEGVLGMLMQVKRAGTSNRPGVNL